MSFYFIKTNSQPKRHLERCVEVHGMTSDLR